MPIPWIRLVVMVDRPAELIVLLPQVSLYLLDCERELQEGGIPFFQRAVVRGEQCRRLQRRSGCASRTQSLQKFTPSDEAPPAGINVFFNRFVTLCVR